MSWIAPKKKLYIISTFVHIMLILIIVIMLFPLLWLYLTSIKLPTDIFATPPVWMPSRFTLENFQDVLFVRRFYLPLLNTIITSVISTVFALIIGSIAAYGLVKHKHAGIIAIFILVFRMIPQIMIIIPLFVFFSKLKLIDTRIALILTFITFQLPFIIWLMRSFFSEVPTELEESAKIDGCGPMGALIRIILPVSAPGLAAAAILTLIVSWNEYMFALVITRTMASMTMPVAINQLVTFEKLIWSGMAAESVIFTLPIILISILVQRNIVRGMTMGAIK
jgi:multiple sugar transport system permease protein